MTITYIGYFNNGEFHGYGKRHYSNGKFHEGLFENCDFMDDSSSGVLSDEESDKEITERPYIKSFNPE